MHRPRAAGAWRIRAPRLPYTWPAPIHATQGPARPRRRRASYRRYHRAGRQVRALWISHGDGFAEQRRLVCEPQAGRTDLAT